MTIDSTLNLLRARCPVDCVVGFAHFVGAGAAIPTVTPNATFPSATNMATPRATSAAVTIARTGPGDYTFTFAQWVTPSKLLHADASSPGAAGLDSWVRSAVITNGQLVIRTLSFTAAGVATDLATTDELWLEIIGAIGSAA